MTADLGILNPPNSNVDPYTQLGGIQLHASVPTASSIILLVPYGINFHPASLILSATTGVTVEYSCSPVATIQDDEAHSHTNALWTTISSPAGFNSILSQIKAIRITTTTTAITAELAV